MSLRGLKNHVAALIGALALGIAVGWIAYKALGNGVSATGDLPQFIIVTLNGLTLAGLYFIIASGFTLIFGLMRIVNMATARSTCSAVTSRSSCKRSSPAPRALPRRDSGAAT